MGFSARLKRARDMKGLSQEDMATMMNVTDGTISNYEKGKAFPRWEGIKKICEILDVDPNYLFWDDLSDPLKIRIERDTEATFDGLNTEGTAKARDYIEDLKGNPKYTAERGIGEKVAADIGKIAARSRARTDTI